MKDINGKLLTAISKNLPPDNELVQYLTDLLDLSRKSVLRKIRGESQFSMEEVSIISSELNISLDDIIGQYKKDRIYFDIDTRLFLDPEDVFIQMFTQDNEILKKISQAENKQTIICLNTMFFLSFVKYEKIFEFAYYKYLQRTKPETLHFKMSDLAIPPEFDRLRKERLEMENTLGNITYILDDNIMQRATNEILYYYERNLITGRELILLKEDLYRVLETKMFYIQSGVDNYNKNILIYYSRCDIESNCTYYECDENIYSQFWHYLVDPITISDPDVCAFQKRWLESLKKKSTLITQSNEMSQQEFILKQQKAVENMIINNTP